MAVLHRPSDISGPRTVDIAGTRWPVHKLEALALGLLTCVILLLVTDSPQVAVLAAAAVAALRWIAAPIVRRLGLPPLRR